MQEIYTTGTETALSRLILTNTDWVLSFFSLVNDIDFSRFYDTPECFQKLCCFYVNLKCVYTILSLHSLLMDTDFHHDQCGLGHLSYMQFVLLSNLITCNCWIFVCAFS